MWWVVNATLRPLYLHEKTGIRCVGGWLGLRIVLEKCGKSRPKPWFDPRTVHPVASRYTNCAIPAHIPFTTMLLISTVIFKKPLLHFYNGRAEGQTPAMPIVRCVAFRELGSSSLYIRVRKLRSEILLSLLHILRRDSFRLIKSFVSFLSLEEFWILLFSLPRTVIK